MKKMLFLLLLWPVLIKAQRTEWDIAFLKNVPDSLTRPIHMPERDYNPRFRYDDTVSYFQKSRVFIVRSDSVYHELFWRYTYTNDSLKKYKKLKTDPWWYHWMEKHHVDSLPVIDFSKNELVMYSTCSQCLVVCNHQGMPNEPCHRNVCNFTETWFIRKRKD